MTNLSTAQSNIVRAPFRPMLVLASAGSGKTRVLTERVRYIMENTRKDGVIALTFTNKAAEEMLGRLDGLDGIDERCWIGTIHAVAQRIVDRYGHSIGLPSELHIYERDLDRTAVFLQSLRQSGADVDAFLEVSVQDTGKDRERRIRYYMDQFSIIKRELLTEEEVKVKYAGVEVFWRAFQAYQDALLEGGGIDFDDILVYAHKILLEQPWCGDIYRAKYKHVCVDEAQDLNRAQYEFIKALCGDQIKSIMMVGDPNQMIYGFNGSSHDYLCRYFLRDFDPQTYELKENYRNSKRVIELANRLKPSAQVESKFACEGKSQIRELEDEDTEALWICDKIDECLCLGVDSEIEGAISLDHMVVIARNRFVFQTLEKRLEERQIPYALKMGERQVEPSSVLGRVLDLAIRLRLNPRDWVDGLKLCEVLRIETPDAWGKADLLTTFADDVRNSRIPFADFQAYILEAVQDLDLERPNILKMCADLDEPLSNHLSDDDSERERSMRELQGFKDCWTAFRRKGLGESLSSFRNAMALGQLTGDYSPSGLTLSTVHTMKGLEKDIVFLMGMCEGVFPDYRATTAQSIEEERNNAYVAVTRSRRWIFITYPKQRMMPWGATRLQNPSQFIRQMQGL